MEKWAILGLGWETFKMSLEPDRKLGSAQKNSTVLKFIDWTWEPRKELPKAKAGIM